MRIEQVTDIDVLREFHGVRVAACAYDHVGLPADPFEELVPSLHPVPEDPNPTSLFVLRDGGAVVALSTVGLPQRENQQVADVDVVVHPDHRGRGHGTALLRQALDHARALGRTVVHGQVPTPWLAAAEPGPSERMLLRAGAHPELYEARRLLDLTDLGPGASPGAAPAGYRLEQWVDVAPEALLDGLARLAAGMSTDAPSGGLQLEPEVWDAARYRAGETAARARNRRRVVTVVVHEATGHVAGMSDVGVNRDRPEVAYQWDTIVDRAHRGHGLGRVLKAHNLALLRRTVPGARWVNTWNALSNTHMIAVNDLLGFVPVERWTEWELTL